MYYQRCYITILMDSWTCNKMIVSEVLEKKKKLLICLAIIMSKEPFFGVFYADTSVRELSRHEGSRYGSYSSDIFCFLFFRKVLLNRKNQEYHQGIDSYIFTHYPCIKYYHIMWNVKLLWN